MVINPSFTVLERKVLDAVCEMHPADRSALESQLARAVIRSRENTGAGFYTRFEVDSSQRAVSGDRTRAGPNATIEGLQHGMGFILWLDRGYAATLEGYSFDEDTSSIQFDAVNCELNPIFR